MIRINLLREKKPKKAEISPYKKTLREIRIGELVKLVKVEVYLSVALWLSVLGVGAWYWKASTQLNKIKREVDQLQAEKNRLSVQAQRIVEEKKKIESEINQLKSEIDALDRSKDILIGLKELYIPFNEGFKTFSSSVPPASWIIAYNQTLDVGGGKLTTEFELSSFDYNSISAYTVSLKKANNEVFVSSIERKTNPSGYEYYFARLNVERSIGGK